MLAGAAILFAMGVAHDALNARFLSAVRDGRRTTAALLSGLLTAFGYVAWFIMTWTGVEGTAAGVAAYAAGAGVGTWAGFTAPPPRT